MKFETISQSLDNIVKNVEHTFTNATKRAGQTSLLLLKGRSRVFISFLRCSRFAQITRYWRIHEILIMVTNFFRSLRIANCALFSNYTVQVARRWRKIRIYICACELIFIENVSQDIFMNVGHSMKNRVNFNLQTLHEDVEEQAYVNLRTLKGHVSAWLYQWNCFG